MPILAKLALILINQGQRGIEALSDLLDDYSGEEKNRVILSVVYYPMFMKNMMVPIFLEDLQSKKLPSSRRN